MSVAGTSFGRYQLLREIGRGGEAIVHLAEDAVLKRRVALKVFPRAMAVGPAEPPAGFRHEVEVLSRLRHPGICTVHDAGVEDGSAFIAMSYVEGSTLAERGGLGEPEAARIGEEVAGIVAAAHAVSVVHGDLKPANVLVTPEGRCVVLDFGVARFLDDASQSNRVAGTLPYLAPECLVRPPDVRADVYGLAALLFELVAGRPPHAAPTRAALLRLIQEEDPPLLRAVAPGASRDLEAVLAKALDRDPARRYATMAEFASDLARLRRGEPASARPLGPIDRAVRWARRHRSAAVLAVFSFLFLTIAAAVTTDKNRALGRHFERAGVAARRADDAARAAQDHLVRFERLADQRRIADLEARAAALVPPHPGLLPALRAWLAEAELLGRRLGAHREALAELRSRGRAHELPDSGPSHPEGSPGILSTRLSREIASLKARHARLSASRDPQPAGPGLRRLIEQLEASLPQTIRTAYASDADAWHDETLAALIAELERFTDPDRYRGTMADVAQRVEDVRTIEGSLRANEAAWGRACRSIADKAECPGYDGLVIKPQLGLVPLRRDPASGLWEFLHVLSGEAPREWPEVGIEMQPGSGIVLVLLPGGIARIGARRPDPGDPPEGPHLDPLADPHESPVADVMLDPFFMSKFEMTLPQWSRVRGRNPVPYLQAHPLKTLPVFGMDWNEATLALARLGLEIPTEAQWEHAARAGTTTSWWTGGDPSSLLGAAVFLARWPEPVGERRPNAFGLHDVAGNVAEWCRDVYARYAVRARGTGLSTADNFFLDVRVVRGGACDDSPKNLRSASRQKSHRTVQERCTGVRPARLLDR